MSIEPLAIDETALKGAFAAAFAAIGEPRAGAPGAIAIEPDRVEQDIAKLVLTLVEFLRRLLEMQAVRRMEAGSLSPDAEEALGLTLMRAREKIHDMARQFGLKPGDLTLELGPLGRLM
jgi:hypothetical protein